MALPTTTALPAVPRRVFVYGVLLSLSLACLGIVGSRLVYRLNAAYQEIVSRQLPAVVIMRAVSQANASGRRMLDGLPAAPTEEQIEQVWRCVSEMRDANSARLARLQELMDSDEGRALTLAVVEARSRYRSEADDFMRQIRGGMTGKQRVDWSLRLADADAEYVGAQDRLADYCTNSAVSVKEELSTRSERLILYFLLVAAWPFILAFGFFFSGLLSTLYVFYRRNR